MTHDISARLEELMVRYGIGELDIEEGDVRLCLRHRAMQPQPPAQRPGDTPRPGQETAFRLHATHFGTLHLSHPASGAAPRLPRKVRRGEIIACVSVGPLLRPILAPRNAVLVTLLQTEGAEIGFGDPLFEAVEDAALP